MNIIAKTIYHLYSMNERLSTFGKFEEEKQEELRIEPLKPYYLFDFSNHELMDLLRKNNEWSSFDQELALWILKERGREVDPKEFSNDAIAPSDNLSATSKYSRNWLYIGFIINLIVGLPKTAYKSLFD